MSGTLPPCVSDPLGTVSALFDAASRSADPRALEDGDWGVRATFERALGEPGVLARVPEINAVGVDAIPPGALVRFRCMVQDMYNPEYYVGAYREEGANGPAWRTTKYTEDPGPGPSPGAEVAGQSGGPHDPSSVKIWERRVLYCVPVPGESEWVRVADGAGAGAPPRTPAKAREGDVKRRRGRLGGDDDADTDADAPDSPTPMDDEAPSSPPTTTETTGATDAAPIAPSSGGRPVRVRSDDAGAPDELNLPLGPAETAAPDVPRRAGSLPAPTPCIVKLYDDFERRPGTTGEGSSGDDSGGDFDVKLNDVLELVGVLAIAPELAGEREELEAAAAEAAALRGAGDANAAAVAALRAGASLGFDFMDEERAHNPPTSVVPRFHALAARRAQSPHAFALLPDRLGADQPRGLTEPYRGPRGLEIRDRLLAHLAAPLGGDLVAAEYVLFALVSRVHTRTEAMALGKFSVALLGADDRTATRLASAIATIAPCVAHVPLSIANLNARSWAPRKDYALNRLRSGPLQLAEGTTLVLDECALSAGTLTETGVRNVRALRELAEAQEVEYDFQYHQMRAKADAQVIVVSPSARDGGSVAGAGADAKVPLRAVAEPGAPPPATEEALAEMRRFVARARASEHSIGEAASKDIEAAMVAARRSAGGGAKNAGGRGPAAALEEAGATQETFHRWLTMARLAAISAGETDLTLAHWNRAMELERVVEERLRVC